LATPIRRKARGTTRLGACEPPLLMVRWTGTLGAAYTTYILLQPTPAHNPSPIPQPGPFVPWDKVERRQVCKARRGALYHE